MSTLQPDTGPRTDFQARQIAERIEQLGVELHDYLPDGAASTDDLTAEQAQWVIFDLGEIATARERDRRQAEIAALREARYARLDAIAAARGAGEPATPKQAGYIETLIRRNPGADQWFDERGDLEIAEWAQVKFTSLYASVLAAPWDPRCTLATLGVSAEISYESGARVNHALLRESLNPTVSPRPLTENVIERSIWTDELELIGGWVEHDGSIFPPNGWTPPAGIGSEYWVVHRRLDANGNWEYDCGGGWRNNLTEARDAALAQ